MLRIECKSRINILSLWQSPHFCPQDLSQNGFGEEKISYAGLYSSKYPN